MSSGMSEFAELFYGDPHIHEDKMPDQARNLVGTSLSKCLVALRTGKVPVERVALIITSTKHPFSEEYVLERWKGKEADIVMDLWKGGRIHQPRAVSDEYDEGLWPTVTRLPYPNEKEEVAPVWYTLSSAIYPAPFNV